MKLTLLFLYEILVFIPILLVSTILMSVTAVLGCLLGLTKSYGYYPGVLWGRLICLAALSPVKVSGRENIDPTKQYIFVANHQGAADIVLLLGYLNNNFRWMLRKEIKKLPFLGWCCEHTDQVWVDSHGTSGQLATRRKATKILKAGLSMMIFPEGTRSVTGEISRFKKGAFALASELNVTVVPVTIDGPFQLLPKGKWIINPHQLTITIHKPLDMKKDEEDEKAYIIRLARESQDIITTELARIRQNS